METVSHEGEVFTKATVLAKKYRYTTDYIGQLCRAGKVTSKLIGRAWFVNEESLLRHKSDRYASIRPAEIIINESVVTEKKVAVGSPLRIRAVLSKATVRNLPKEHQVVVHHDSYTPTNQVTYHNDFGALQPLSLTNKVRTETPKINGITPHIPETQTEITKNIPILLGEKAKHTLTFEPLPEVSLTGNLAIISLDDPDLFKETKPVSISEINFIPQSITQNPIKPIQTSLNTVTPASVPIKYATNIHPTPARPAPTPHAISNSIRVEKVITEVKGTRVSFLAVPVFVLGAVLLCVGLFSGTSFIEFDGFEFRESLKFSVANVYEVVEEFPRSY